MWGRRCDTGAARGVVRNGWGPGGRRGGARERGAGRMSGFVAVVSLSGDTVRPWDETSRLADHYRALRGQSARTAEVGKGDCASAVGFDADVRDDDRGWTLLHGSVHGAVPHPLPSSALAGLDGQFATVSWDPATRVLLAATDGFATSPVYVCRQGDLLYVATSALVLARHLRPRASARGVRHFLVTGNQFGPLTHWEDVRRLEPGSFVEVADGKVADRFYWAPRPDPALEALDLRAASDRLTDAMVGALAERCRDQDTWPTSPAATTPGCSPSSRRAPGWTSAPTRARPVPTRTCGWQATSRPAGAGTGTRSAPRGTGPSAAAPPRRRPGGRRRPARGAPARPRGLGPPRARRPGAPAAQRGRRRAAAGPDVPQRLPPSRPTAPRPGPLGRRRRAAADGPRRAGPGLLRGGPGQLPRPGRPRRAALRRRTREPAARLLLRLQGQRSLRRLPGGRRHGAGGTAAVLLALHLRRLVRAGPPAQDRAPADAADDAPPRPGDRPDADHAGRSGRADDPGQLPPLPAVLRADGPQDRHEVGAAAHRAHPVRPAGRVRLARREAERVRRTPPAGERRARPGEPADRLAARARRRGAHRHPADVASHAGPADHRGAALARSGTEL